MKFLKNKLGQSTVEYIMIFLLVVLVIIGGLQAFATAVRDSVDAQTGTIVDTLPDAPTNP